MWMTGKVGVEREMVREIVEVQIKKLRILMAVAKPDSYF